MNIIFVVLVTLFTTILCSPAVAQEINQPGPYENVVILGDSYSTFDGYIPKGNASWYFTYPSGDCDVISVSQTWWTLFSEATGSHILLNESWSGSTICNTGYNASDCSTWSFIARMENLFSQNVQPDLILIFGGTNDSWAGVPLGDFKYSDWTKEDLYSYLPAACYMLDYITSNAPDTEVVVMLNDSLTYEIVDGLIQISNHYGAKPLVLKRIDKLSGHPSIKGMQQISDQLIEFLRTRS